MLVVVAFATCPVRSSAVLRISKAPSQAAQIITAPVQGSKLSKKMKANAPIKRRAPAARRSSALMAGITVKVIFYGQMLMTDSGRRDGRGLNTCNPCKHSQTTVSLCGEQLLMTDTQGPYCPSAYSWQVIGNGCSPHFSSLPPLRISPYCIYLFICPL